MPYKVVLLTNQNQNKMKIDWTNILEMAIAFVAASVVFAFIEAMIAPAVEKVAAKMHG